MWETLYEGHYNELVAYGVRLFAQRELAEDLVQETFLRALMNADVVEDLSPSQRRAWLFRTFKNLFVDRYRRAMREKELLLQFPSEPAVDQGLQEMENALLLLSVSPQDRAIFHLRHFEGYTAQEIACMMNLPPGTVRSRLARCRKQLQKTLDV